MSDCPASNNAIPQDVTMEALSLLTSVMLLSKVLQELDLYCDSQGNIRTVPRGQANDQSAIGSDSTLTASSLGASFLGAGTGNKASTTNSSDPVEALMAVLGQQLQPPQQPQRQAPRSSLTLLSNASYSNNNNNNNSNFSIPPSIAAAIANSISSQSDATNLASTAHASVFSSSVGPASAAQPQHAEISTSISGRRTRPTRNNRREYRHESFPEKLHRLVTELEAEGREDIISFVGDNEAGFYLSRPDLFEQEVMGNYFRGRKLTTFRRQLVFYGFFRQRKGRNQGAFVNPNFIRGRPDLLQNIVRDDRYDDACGSSAKQDG